MSYLCADTKPVPIISGASKPEDIALYFKGLATQ